MQYVAIIRIILTFQRLQFKESWSPFELWFFLANEKVKYYYAVTQLINLPPNYFQLLDALLLRRS